MKKFFACFLLFLAIFSTGLTAGETTFARDALTSFVNSGECPGLISIFYRPGQEEIVCMGYADVAKKIPMSLDRTFMQCSQTKGFCGVTIAILVEEGKISLDDPVSKYLPEFDTMLISKLDKNGRENLSVARNPITIRMAMNHTAGFYFEVKKYWTQMPVREAARLAAARPLAFEPGTDSRYSNTGIDVGAAIVEVVTGKPWDVFLKERVLDPLGMTDTTFNPTDEQLSRAMSLYSYRAGAPARYKKFSKSMPLPHNGPTVYPSAGAGLWTTATDQLKFCKMLMNLGVGENGVRILREDTMKNLICTNSRPEGLGSYSLGLWADMKTGEIGHGGAFGTQYSINWRNKTIGILAVQLTGTKVIRNAWTDAYQKFAGAAISDEAGNYTERTK